MALAFYDWKRALVLSAGSASAAVSQLGDYVLRLFWEDGCEPTMSAMMDYAQAGLCGRFNVITRNAQTDRGQRPRKIRPAASEL